MCRTKRVHATIESDVSRYIAVGTIRSTTQSTQSDTLASREVETRPAFFFAYRCTGTIYVQMATKGVVFRRRHVTSETIVCTSAALLYIQRELTTLVLPPDTAPPTLQCGTAAFVHDIPMGSHRLYVHIRLRTYTMQLVVHGLWSLLVHAE